MNNYTFLDHLPYDCNRARVVCQLNDWQRTYFPYTELSTEIKNEFEKKITYQSINLLPVIDALG